MIKLIEQIGGSLSTWLHVKAIKLRKISKRWGQCAAADRAARQLKRNAHGIDTKNN